MDPRDRKKFPRKLSMTNAEREHVRVTTTERTIHSQFISFLRRHELPYTHSDPTRKSSIKVGHPDFLVGLVDNRGFYLEFKIPPNRLTTEQINHFNFLELKGNKIVVASETSQGAAYAQATREVAKFFNLMEGFE